MGKIVKITLHGKRRNGNKPLAFSKVVIIKRRRRRKKKLPVGANSFLLEKTPFQNGYDVQKSKQEVTKVVSLA